MKIWINGDIKDAADATISVMDRGLQLADGFFDTMLVKYGHGVFYYDHLERIFDTAKVMRISLPQNLSAQLLSALNDLSNFNLHTDDLGVMRIAITRGIGARGLLPPTDSVPNIIVTLAPYKGPSYLNSSNHPCPVKACETSYRRNETTPLANYKTNNYTDEIHARMIATENGYDEILMRNTKNQLCSASIGNLFCMRDGQIFTPPLSSGCLNGITRKYLLNKPSDRDENRPDIKMPRITEEIITTLDGQFFMSNSLMGCVPLDVGQPMQKEDLEFIKQLNQKLSQLADHDIS